MTLSSFLRKTASALAALGTAGCLTWGEGPVTVRDVDGSSDHRIFRIGALTKVMMEPVLWRLEDSRRIDFDRPVGEFIPESLPPEFDRITLRDLHENRAGLPMSFATAWRLGDWPYAVGNVLFGTGRYARFDTRAEFFYRLWMPDVRRRVARGEAVPSDMGYALMMMAIVGRLGETPEELCRKYLVEPYGLKDTSFNPPSAADAARLTPPCAGTEPWLWLRGMAVRETRDGEISGLVGGLCSSASDVLRVAYVILPHLDRAKAQLESHRYDFGRTVWYQTGTTGGGYGFIGFDPVDRRAVVILRNATDRGSEEGLELMEGLTRPGRSKGLR